MQRDITKALKIVDELNSKLHQKDLDLHEYAEQASFSLGELRGILVDIDARTGKRDPSKRPAKKKAKKK